MTPILFSWDGEVMRPVGHVWAKRADKEFVIGEAYTLDQHFERSTASHRQYFAAVNEAWKNLPEALAADFPSMEHLRHYALIKAGFCDSNTLVCSSKAEAIRVAAFIRPNDEYSIVTVSGLTVTRFVAKSQSYRAMPGGEFERSKEAVLGIVSAMIGTTPAELKKAEAA